MGKPLCLPRSIIAQTINLPKTVKCPDSEVEFVGCPSERPTLLYAKTTSKKMENTEKAYVEGGEQIVGKK
jgi:hypothetical protein